MPSAVLYVGYFAVCTFPIYLCYLVGKQARAKGHPFIVGFLLSLFLTPIVGFLIVYLLAESKSRPGPLKCPVCGAVVALNQPTCLACGIRFEPE